MKRTKGAEILIGQKERRKFISPLTTTLKFTLISDPNEAIMK